MRDFFAHDLQRDRLLRAPVEGEKHLAHAPFAEALADLVAVVDDRPLTYGRGAVQWGSGIDGRPPSSPASEKSGSTQGRRFSMLSAMFESRRGAQRRKAGRHRGKSRQVD